MKYKQYKLGYWYSNNFYLISDNTDDEIQNEEECMVYPIELGHPGLSVTHPRMAIAIHEQVHPQSECLSWKYFHPFLH